MRPTVIACALMLLFSVGCGVLAHSLNEDPGHGPHGHSHGSHGHGHGPHGHSHGPHGHSHEASAPAVASQHDTRLLALPAPGSNAEQNRTRQAVAAALVDHDFRRALSAAQPWVVADRFDPWTLMAASDAHLELGQLNEAEASLQRVLDVKPTAPTYFRAAFLLHMRGYDEDAIATLKLALDTTPRSASQELAWTLSELGDLQRFSGDFAAAHTSYQRALAADGAWGPARVGLAKCARAQGDLDQAVRYLRQAPPSAATLSELALLETSLGRLEQAERDLHAALALGRSDDHYARMLAHALADHGVAGGEAVALARHELTVRPTAHTWDALAHALWADGQPAEALAAAKRALSWGTQEPELLFHAGLAAAACGERQHARAWLGEAYRRDPGLTWHPHAPALDTL